MAVDVADDGTYRDAFVDYVVGRDYQAVLNIPTIKKHKIKARTKYKIQNIAYGTIILRLMPTIF